MERAMESDDAARNANNDELIGLLLLRQAVVTRSLGTMTEETYKQARDSAVAELKHRLNGGQQPAPLVEGE
jgi:hypothetical protein